MVNYLIFGNGYIGNYLAKKLKNVELIKDKIYDLDKFCHLISIYKADVVINCIAKTGNPNVDWCEDHKRETFFSNVLVPDVMAEKCETLGIHFINFGTGCVFESSVPLPDYAKPNFFGSFYSRTKAMCEDLLSERKTSTTLRIRMPTSGEAHVKNILYKVKNFKKVTDIPNSITFMEDICNAIPFVVEHKVYGNINLMHPQVTSIKELALATCNTNIEVVGQGDLQIGARANTILVPDLLLMKGFKFCDFSKTLQKYSEDMNKHDDRNSSTNK